MAVTTTRTAGAFPATTEGAPQGALVTVVEPPARLPVVRRVHRRLVERAAVALALLPLPVATARPSPRALPPPPAAAAHADRRGRLRLEDGKHDVAVVALLRDLDHHRPARH